MCSPFKKNCSKAPLNIKTTKNDFKQVLFPQNREKKSKILDSIECAGGGSGGGGSGTEPTPDPGAGGTGTSITITQDNNFGSNLHEIQGTISVTCKDGPNPASTLRCCPKNCYNGTLSSNLIMGGGTKRN
ncbi:MAG: hypothetical protein J6A06_08760 [Fibrobacteraceae bacterium]|nr:hypothetical protein [Fibrobacteraceae bacterium]